MSTPPTASMNPPGAAPQGPPGNAIGLKSGTKLGKYEIVGRLGLGGMALVYKGYDPLLDRFVAIKQIASHLASDPKFMDRFRKEAQILAKLGVDQASVVQIYELIEDPRGLFIVMEYVEGQTLDVLIARQKGPMPMQLALEILWHLAVGLRAVHERGIIHRDIKPANVMVGVNHRCKITDFGVAARHGGKTSMTLGTTKYMAPELFGGDEVDGRVDVYSLGCIAYEMLCGPEKFQQIFKDVLRDEQAEALRWMKWHTNRELMAPMLNQVNPKVPEVLAKIVAKMMAKDPKQRFASAEHVLEIFKRHFTQMGKAQKAQASKQARAKAAAAAAVAATTAARIPEPIPDRPAEPAQARSRHEPPALPSSPGTTRLPKRKLTRRQRIAVLGSLLGLILLGMITFFTIQSVRHQRLTNEAAVRYDQAREEWQRGNFDTKSMRWVNDHYLAARAMLVEINEDPQLSKTEYGGKPARARIDWIDARLAMQRASNMARQLWPTTHDPLPDDVDHDEHRAGIAAQWALAEEGRKRVLEQRILRDDVINALEKDILYERNFLVKVEEALNLIEQGFSKLDTAPIIAATQVLEVAQTIKKNEDLTDLFNFRNRREAECRYRDLVNRAKEALASNQAAQAEELLNQANTASGGKDAEVTRLLRQIAADKRFDAAKREADRLWNDIQANRQGVNLQQALDTHRRLDSIRPSKETKDRIYRIETGQLYQRAEAAFSAKQYPLAKSLFEQVLGRNPTPGMKTAIQTRLDAMKKQDDLASVMASLDKAMADNDMNTVRTLLTQARNLGAPADTLTKYEDQRRQRLLRDALADANKALTDGNYDDATQKYNEARRRLAPGDAAGAAQIDQKLEEIRARRQVEKNLADGDALLREGKYELALREYTRVLDFVKDLRKAHEPPPPQPTGRGPRGAPPPPPQAQAPKVPMSVIQEFETKARERIRETNYQRYIFNGRGEMDRRQWTAALGWLKMARSEVVTPEVEELIRKVEQEIGDEDARRQ